MVIFSAETENLIEDAKGKLVKKHADFVVANDVTKEGAGFYGDTNIARIISKDGYEIDSGLVSKDALANIILDIVAERK
jgi:phosphopantothenoylcysteine decarboxylase/phosphopantothenate--cysteine ligase